jgi:DNA-binding NtrC family response regulator
MTPEAMAMITSYDWPGNVRQLENAVFRAIVLSDGGALKPDDFPQISGLAPATAHAAPGAAASADAGDQPVTITDDAGELRTLEQIERDLIQYAIDHYSGHMSEVARRLGIGRSTLYRKVREYDLRVRDGEELDEAV